MEIKKLEIENDQKMKQQKPRKINLKARIDFPYEMGSWWHVISISHLCGMNVSSIRIMLTPCLVLLDNIFSRRTKKLEIKWSNNQPKFIITNWKSCKLDVINFLPFRSQIEKERMKTWFRPNNRTLTCKFFECWNDIWDRIINNRLMLVYKAFGHIDALIFWKPLIKP